MKSPIQIIDATLREGDQSPGVALDVGSSVAIAKALNTLPIDMIEAGHPAISALEFERVRQVVKTSRIPVMGHARARLDDVKQVSNTDATWCGIFAGVNETSQRDRIGKSLPDILQLIDSSIRYARILGLKVRYTVEDGSNTRLEDLLLAYDVAIRAGADRICYADTVGKEDMTDILVKVSMLRRWFPGVELEVHLHDDLGLAMANALVAAQAGADYISATINGIGERAGITNTCVLLANLINRGLKPAVPMSLIRETSDLVAGITGAQPDAWRPVTGANTTVHTAKLHQDAVARNPNCYNWMNPAIWAPDIKSTITH